MSQQYSRWQELQQQPGVTRTSQLEELRLRVHQFVIDQVGPMLSDDAIDEAELRRLVQEQVHKGLGDEQTALSAAERVQLIQDVTDDTLGYGPIDRFLHDPGITEVMVNGPESVYIERRGKLEPTDVEFVDEDHLRRTIDKIVSQVGRRIDEASPMVDARLPDGSRVNAVIHPVAIGGPFLTIRRFSASRTDRRSTSSPGPLSPQWPNCLGASWLVRSTWSSRAVPAPARRRCSTCCRRSFPKMSGSSPSKTRAICSCTQGHVARSRLGHRTSRDPARSRSGNSVRNAPYAT